MHLDLIDALRCVRPHEDTWLVAAAAEITGRRLVRGTLGCPVCHAEYPVRDGVAFFDPALPDAAPADAAPAHPAARADEDEVMRLAALLALTAPGGTIVLGGAWDACAEALLDLVETRALLAEPARRPSLRDELGPVRGAAVVPLAGGAARGVALDSATATPARLASAVHVLRAGGRLVAPVDAPLPSGVRELARDARHWVAEREGAPGPLVSLRRA
jgi:hypothetical protein